MDVSFISQTLILPSVADLLDEDGVCVTLIKPQFEVGRENVGKNGIVILSKITGLILAAMAAQMIFTGAKNYFI